MQNRSAGVTGSLGWHGEQPQAQSLRIPGPRRLAGEGEHLLQAVISQASATTACQMRFWSSSSIGRFGQPGVLRRADTVLGAGAAAVPQLEVGELRPGPPGGVGGERGVAQSIRVGDPRLRPGMWSFATDDHPHPCRPGGQVHQAGGLDDPGPGPGFPVGVQSGLPVLAGEGGELVDHGLGEAEPDRIGQTLPVEPVEELVGRASSVDADQAPAAGLVTGLVSRQLTQGGADGGDVVNSGVRPGVARAQQRGGGLPGAVRAVVDERPQRMVPEALLERRRSTPLVRVSRHQGARPRR